MQQGCKDRPLLPEGQGPMASWHSPYVCSHVHNNIFRQPCLCAPYLTFPQLKHQFGPWRSSWEYWGEDNHLQAKWWLHQNQLQLVFCLHGPKQPETNVLAYPHLANSSFEALQSHCHPVEFQWLDIGPTYMFCISKIMILPLFWWEKICMCLCKICTMCISVYTYYIVVYGLEKNTGYRRIPGLRMWHL